MSEVVIVGGGLAGLACAIRLQEAGVDFVLLEGSDEVGGRVRTDAADGFLFDRGFQVLLSSYPEAARLLDYEKLDLHYFDAGCFVHREGELLPMMDPWRHPSRAWGSLFGPHGSLLDKIRLARLRNRVSSVPIEELLQRPDVSTRQALINEGFDEEIRQRFFRPFLGGVFLDPDLETSSRKFHWMFRMFAKGRAALPSNGMRAIGLQLASRLAPERLRLNTRVASVGQGRVSLEDGRDLLCAQIVVATDPATAVRFFDGLPQPRFRAVCSLYYSMDEAPVRGPVLILNGDGRGPVNHLTFLSEVVPTYAPRNRALASVTVLGNPSLTDRELDDVVRQQLVDWFGMVVGEWRLERMYRIDQAVPEQLPGSWSNAGPNARLQDWLVIAGDWRNLASINGALESGRLAAEAVLEKVLD